MMMSPVWWIGCSAAVLLGLAMQGMAEPGAATAPAALRMVIIGDSTVCAYAESKPDRGWGQFIGERFRDGSVAVSNLAAPGRSTKTFIREGRWAKALEIRPQVVLIQFGHNDSHAKEKPESTDAATDYRTYLHRYIEEARAIGAMPVLVTPMVRRRFDEQGKIAEPTGAGNLVPYASAMREVGREKQVPVIDLYASSLALVERMGPEACEGFANKPGDVTHFNETGARAMAELVMQELPEAVPQLRALLKAK